MHELSPVSPEQLILAANRIEQNPTFSESFFATARSLHALLLKLKKQGLGPSQTVIRYIDTSGRKLIL
jgi:hypothetical protein